MPIIAGVNTDDPRVIAIAKEYAAKPDVSTSDSSPVSAYGDFVEKPKKKVSYDPNDPKIIEIAREYANGTSVADKKSKASKAGDAAAQALQDGIFRTLGVSPFFNKDVKKLRQKISDVFGGDDVKNHFDILSEAYAENYLGIDRLANSLMGDKKGSENARKALGQMQDEFDSGNPDISSSVEKELFKLGPYLMVPGVDEIAPIKALSKLPKILKMTGSAAKFSAAPLAYGAANASPDQSITEAALESLATAGLINGASKAVFNAPAWFVSKSSVSTPEKILENLKTQEGKPITGGDVMEMPKLAKFQDNVMANMSLGGQASSFNQIIKNLKDMASDVFKKSGANIATGYENSNSIDLLKELNKSIKSQGKELYDDFENKFYASGDKLDLSKARDAAKKNLEEYSKYVQTFPSATDAQFVDILNEVSNLPDKEAAQLSLPGILKDAPPENIAKQYKFRASELDELAKQQKGKYAEGVYRDLANGLRNSVKESAKKSNNPEVLDALKKADKYHSEVTAKLGEEPFKSLLKFKTSKTGANLYNVTKNAMLNDEQKFKKIMDLMGDDGKSLLLTKYFASARNPDKTINSSELLKKFDKIGQAQKEMLFSPETLKAFQSLKDSTRFAKSALNFITRNPNGSANSLIISSIVQGIAGGKGLMALIHGHVLYPMLVASIVGGSHILRRYLLDNPKFIQWLMESAVSKGGDAKFILSAATPGLGAAGSQAIGALTNG